MIEVFDPIIGEEEIEAVVAALRRGEISGSFGESIPRFEEGQERTVLLGNRMLNLRDIGFLARRV